MFLSWSAAPKSFVAHLGIMESTFQLTPILMDFVFITVSYRETSYMYSVRTRAVDIVPAVIYWILGR